MIAPLVFAILLPASSSSSTNADEARAPGRQLDLDRALTGPGRAWTAEEAIQAAVQTSPTVRQAAAEEVRAKAQLQAAWSDVLPRVALNARYTRISRIDNDRLVPVEVDPVSAQAAVDAVADPAARAVLQTQLDADLAAADLAIEVPQNQYALSAEIQYPVSAVFTRILPAIRAQRRTAAARHAELDVARNTVALLIVQAYFDHARARSALSVAALSVRRAQDNLAQAEARLANDVGNHPDVLRFRARLASAEAERSEAFAEVGRVGRGASNVAPYRRRGTPGVYRATHDGA